MKIEVYSLNRALGKVKHGGNWISIRDSYHGEDVDIKYDALDRRIRKHQVNSLVIHFDDIDPYRFYHGMEHPIIKEKFKDETRTPIFFNADIARNIVDWVREKWEKDHSIKINVHCHAGRSRSQAVAYWLNIYFNLILDRNIEDYTANNALNIYDKIHFNCEVLKVFSQTFG